MCCMRQRNTHRACIRERLIDSVLSWLPQRQENQVIGWSLMGMRLGVSVVREGLSEEVAFELRPGW